MLKEVFDRVVFWVEATLSINKILFLVLVLNSCVKSGAERETEMEISEVEEIYPFVDPDSPIKARPLMNIGFESFTLVFSDEFNDSEIDGSKWNVQEKFIRDRGVFNLYASKDDVEEKNGHLYIYYRKDTSVNDNYYAGRIDSNGKYALTYGFLECRIHLVKPNGHQTAFWMMPEGKGMKVPDGVDGTANDGAEIDIIEGNKTNTFSCGLHWDGYGSEHRSNGKNISVPAMHDLEYHTIGFEWNEKYLKWYFDGDVVREIVNPVLIPKVPHYIYFSGSMWAESTWVDGNILANDLIQNGGVDKAYIDYIRIFEK